MGRGWAGAGRDVSKYYMSRTLGEQRAEGKGGAMEGVGGGSEVRGGGYLSMKN